MKIAYEKLKNPGTRVILRLLEKHEGKEGLKIIQKALNRMGKTLAVDGEIGPITIAAIKNVNNKELHAKIEEIQLFGDKRPEGGNIAEPFWLKYAFDELGVKEVPGPGNNPRVLEYHAVSGGFSKDSVPWCASFVNFIMLKAGYKGPKWPAAAKSWLNFGKSSHYPVEGAIAVKSRKGGGHVCFVVGRDKTGKYLYCLGGNQSDAVNIKKYPANVFIDFRVPEDYDLTKASLPIYKGKASYAGKES